MDLDVLFLGTAGVGADLAAWPCRLPGAAWRRADPGRLRRGHAAADAALERPAWSTSTWSLITHFHADHVLGLPGMLKTFALRAREAPLHDLRPRRPAGADRLARPRDRPAAVSAVELVELDPGETLRARRLPDRAVRHRPRVPSLGYALVRGRSGPVGSTSRRHGAGRARGPAVRGAAARPGGDARVGRGGDAASRSSAPPGRGAGSCSRATPVPCRHAGRGVRRRRPAGARGHVPRGGARPRRGDRAYDGDAGRAARAATPR